jgi:folate-binding protein YgfZ
MDLESQPLSCEGSTDSQGQADHPPSPWDWAPPQGHVLCRAVSLLQLQGPDSLRFLHGQTSQAIAAAKPGQWLSTCCISPTARMRALAEVLVTETGAWLLITAGDGATVRQALDRVLFPADAVQLGKLQPAWLLSPLPTPALACGGWRPLDGDVGFWLGDQLVLPGEQEPPSSAAAPQIAGLEAGAQRLLGQPRLDGAGQERWRLQRAEPGWPQEVNDATNPFELGLAGRVSLNKGCYVGQEALAKLATYDGVRQQLRRWVCEVDPDGEDAAARLASGRRLESADGERAGVITSSLQLEGSSTWIGLALVRRSLLGQVILRTVGAAAGQPDGNLTLHLSQGEGFLDPPVGPGGIS